MVNSGEGLLLQDLVSDRAVPDPPGNRNENILANADCPLIKIPVISVAKSLGDKLSSQVRILAPPAPSTPYQYVITSTHALRVREEATPR